MAIIPSKVPLYAQTDYHASIAVNCEVFSSRCMGGDITFLYSGRWGMRYTKVPDLNYLEAAEHSTDLSLLSYSGDFSMPMLLRTIDFRAFNGKSKSMFDFITAYIGAGSNNLSLKLERERFYANGGVLTKETKTETVKAPTQALAFGLYGGERFLVVDWRVLYAKGKTGENNLISKSFSFDAWMMLISIGFGF